MSVLASLLAAKKGRSDLVVSICLSVHLKQCFHTPLLSYQKRAWPRGGAEINVIHVGPQKGHKTHFSITLDDVTHTYTWCAHPYIISL